MYDQSISDLDAEYKLIKLKYKDHKQRKNSLQTILNQASKQQTDNSTKQEYKKKSDNGLNSNEESANTVIDSNNQTRLINVDEIELVKDTTNTNTEVEPHVLKTETKNPPNEENMPNGENSPNEENLKSLLLTENVVYSIPQQIGDLRFIRDTFIRYEIIIIFVRTIHIIYFSN